MTTFTEPKTCERGSGLFVRDCDCNGCEDIRAEFIELHVDLAKAYLTNRSPYERMAHEASIRNQIERFKEFV